MKIEIDTAQKTIRVSGRVNMAELMSALSDMLPDGKWREYELLPEFELTTSPFNTPWTVQPTPYQPSIQPYTHQEPQPLTWPRTGGFPGTKITYTTGEGISVLGQMNMGTEEQ